MACMFICLLRIGRMDLIGQAFCWRPRHSSKSGGALCTHVIDGACFHLLLSLQSLAGRASLLVASPASEPSELPASRACSWAAPSAAAAVWMGSP